MFGFHLPKLAKSAFACLLGSIIAVVLEIMPQAPSASQWLTAKLQGLPTPGRLVGKVGLAGARSWEFALARLSAAQITLAEDWLRRAFSRLGQPHSR